MTNCLNPICDNKVENRGGASGLLQQALVIPGVPTGFPLPPGQGPFCAVCTSVIVNNHNTQAHAQQTVLTKIQDQIKDDPFVLKWHAAVVELEAFIDAITAEEPRCPRCMERLHPIGKPLMGLCPACDGGYRWTPQGWTHVWQKDPGEPK